MREKKNGMKREKHFSRRARGWTLAETRRGEMKKEKKIKEWSRRGEEIKRETGGDRRGGQEPSQVTA